MRREKVGTGEERREWGGGCGRFFTWRQKQGEEPVGSAGNSHARPGSRKALSAVIHYSATSTISLCQAIFTRSDKIDSMYKRIPPPPPPHTPPPLIYLFGMLMRWNGIDVAFIPSLIHQGFERVCLEQFSEASSSKLRGWDTLSWLWKLWYVGVISVSVECRWHLKMNLKDLNQHLASNAECSYSATLSASGHLQRKLTWATFEMSSG